MIDTRCFPLAKRSWTPTLDKCWAWTKLRPAKVKWSTSRIVFSIMTFTGAANAKDVVRKR